MWYVAAGLVSTAVAGFAVLDWNPALVPPATTLRGFAIAGVIGAAFVWLLFAVIPEARTAQPARRLIPAAVVAVALWQVFAAIGPPGPTQAAVVACLTFLVAARPLHGPRARYWLLGGGMTIAVTLALSLKPPLGELVLVGLIVVVGLVQGYLDRGAAALPWIVGFGWVFTLLSVLGDARMGWFIGYMWILAMMYWGAAIWVGTVLKRARPDR